MKSGIELITEEKEQGYDNLQDGDFPRDFEVLSSGIQFAYKTKSDQTIELLIKTGAFIAGEIDRLQSLTPPQQP